MTKVAHGPEHIPSPWSNPSNCDINPNIHIP